MIRCILAVLLLAAALGSATATPSRIIILRHGEKADDWKLCNVGQQRADALALNYLGRDAKNSLFRSGEQPAAFLAITLHTLELVSPAAGTWNMPVTLFSVVPKTGAKSSMNKELDRRTEEAVRDLLNNQAYAGKTVVMVWEHRHIANTGKNSSRAEGPTLRHLLKLDTLKDVPEAWPTENYDYFWLVDFAPGSDVPTGFSMKKQEFAPPFNKLPSNDWGKRNGLKPASGCETRRTKLD